MESGNFSSSTSSSLITQFQTQNFKRQIDLLQQKLDINEKEYQNKIISLTDQISLLNSTEVKLRNQLSNKDKALYELNNILKEYHHESNHQRHKEGRLYLGRPPHCRRHQGKG